MYSYNLTTSNLHYEKFQDGTIERLIFDFDIPDTWELTRLRNIGNIISGGTPKTTEKSYYNGNIPWITPSDMGKQQNRIYFGRASKFISEIGLNNSSAQMIPANSIVYSSRAPIGHINIVNTEFTTNQGCKSIYPLCIDNEFLYWLLKNRTTDIQRRSSGTTFKEISGRSFGDTIVCIPPYQEQKRITRKISIILKNINNYEKYYAELEQLKKDFPEKLRKSILQYAMQGKLVPQYATDESVEVLLERIKEEKQRLFEEGKLKKKDLQESIIYQGDDNSYYEKNNKEVVQLENIPNIPETWKYLRFHQIVNYYMGKTPPRSVSTYWGKDIPWVSIADMVSNGIIQSTKEALSDEFKANIQGKISPPNTLLMSFKLTVGKVSLLGIEAAHNEAIISIFPYADTKEIMKMYLFKFLPEIVKYGDSKEAIKGTTLNSKSIDALLIPLPPMEEQKRIVAKLEKLNLSIAKLIYIKK